MPTVNDPADTQEPGDSSTTEAVKKGSTYSDDELLYVVTSAKASNRTVKVTGAKNKKVTTIGKNVFKGDSKLTSITIKSTSLKKIGADALKGNNRKAKIKVPASKLKAYKKLFKGKGQGKKVTIVK